MASVVCWAAWLLLSLSWLVQAQNVPTLVLLSRPDIRAPVLNVHNYTSDLVAPGYLFFTPATPTFTNMSAGPHIYNNDGQLVWSGYKLIGPATGAFNPQVCPHNGSPHLCFTQFSGPVQGGVGRGSKSKILDQSYTPVVEVAPNGTLANETMTHDLHEFQVVGSGESALLTTYVSVKQNATFPHCPLNRSSVEYIKTGAFVELATDGSNREIFRWNALDHVDPADAYTCPGDMHVGMGDEPRNGFDFFHINSADKDENGDYLVSGRHVSTVYKVAGLKNPKYKPGEIIWRLGGRSNTFLSMDSEVENVPHLNFSYQHHARWQPQLGGISLWNNGNNGIQPASANASSGMVIKIDGTDEEPRATLLAQYISPERQLDSSQGSHQILPNGNHMMGMGSYPYMYEQTASGQLAFYASFGEVPLESYRAQRFEWVGKPTPDEMALFAYAPNCSAPVTWYASWNGATEIAYWKFFTSTEQHGSQWELAGQKMHTNTFETVMQSQDFALWTFAVAYDKMGKKLGETNSVQTFVPDEEKLAGKCGDTSCELGTEYTYNQRASCSANGSVGDGDGSSTLQLVTPDSTNTASINIRARQPQPTMVTKMRRAAEAEPTAAGEVAKFEHKVFQR